LWHYEVLRVLDYLWNTGIKPESRVSDTIETVIERRHQNGRWPLNLLHPEHIPLEMETCVGRASRWNTGALTDFCVDITTERGSCAQGPARAIAWVKSPGNSPFGGLRTTLM